MFLAITVIMMTKSQRVYLFMMTKSQRVYLFMMTKSQRVYLDTFYDDKKSTCIPRA